MSTMSSLLLSLLFLGVVQAQVASDGSEFTAKSFIDVLRNAIEHKETEHLNKVISNQFIFIGCTKNVGKDELLKMLSMIPAGNKAAFKFQSSQFLNEKKNQIAYSVAVSGLGINVDANFVIDSISGNWVLIKGNVPNCPRHLFLVADPAESIAKSFLAEFQKAILSKDGVKIARSISENFLFHGCKGDYTKAKVLGLLASIPKGSKVSMTLKHADYVNGGDVQYTVSVTGFGRPTFDAQFILHKEAEDFVLIGGKVPSCPERRHVGVPFTPESVAKQFLASFNKALDDHNSIQLSRQFSENFVFKGCHGGVNKKKMLAFLLDLPRYTKPEMIFQSAEFLDKLNIQFVVRAMSFRASSFLIEFNLHLENEEYVLIGGKPVLCGGLPPLRRLSVPTHAGSVDQSTLIASSFVQSMVKLISAKDQANLAAIFSDDFLFHGCKGDYTKEKALALFSRIPNGSKIALTFQSSELINDSDIQLSVLASGFGVPDFAASFTLHRENGQYVLIGGKVPKCTTRLFYFY